MHHELKTKDLPTLLALYNQEIEQLKSRLLEGDSWEQLATTRRNITELAIAIHRRHNHMVPKYIHGSTGLPETGQSHSKQANPGEQRTN